MTATTTAAITTADDRTRGVARRAAASDFAGLQERARQTVERAEELLVRSASVLAHSGDVQARVRARSVRAEVSAARHRLADAQTRITHLERALQSNRRIGMALGVLMARHQLAEDQAFDLLRRVSSRRNVKLAALAEEVVYTGGL